MDNAHLTEKQKQFFNYIINFRQEHDAWPTYREIADEFDYKSPNSVTQNIQALVKKRYLIRTSEGYDLHPRMQSHYLRYTNDQEEESGIPIRGLIAAGFMQEAIDNDLGSITFNTLFPKADRMFALRVSGYSMQDVGILDGDLVLLIDEELKDGDIGAVLYDGQTTLKRIYRDAKGLKLVAENETYEPILIEPDIYEEVKIIGKYAGHIGSEGYHKA